MKNPIKIILSILLLLCLFDMPYGYYQLVRFIAFVVFIYLAYLSYQNSDKEWIFVYGGLALLFQPFVKIALGRQMWNIADVVVAILLLFSIWHENRKIES